VQGRALPRKGLEGRGASRSTLAAILCFTGVAVELLCHLLLPSLIANKVNDCGQTVHRAEQEQREERVAETQRCVNRAGQGQVGADEQNCDVRCGVLPGLIKNPLINTR